MYLFISTEITRNINKIITNKHGKLLHVLHFALCLKTVLKCCRMGCNDYNKLLRKLEHSPVHFTVYVPVLKER